MQIEAWDSIAKDVDFNLEIDVSGFTQLVQKDTNILDYGCGYGRNCEALNSLGFNNLLGIDPSPGMISRGNLEYPHLSLKQTQGIPLQYPDSSFGAIVICGVLTCIPEQQAKIDLLSEIMRLLAPEGIIHMVEFCNKTDKTFESKMGVTMHHQQPNQLLGLVNAFTELKFEVIQTQSLSGRNVKAVNYFGRKHLSHNTLKSAG